MGNCCCCSRCDCYLVASAQCELCLAFSTCKSLCAISYNIYLICMSCTIICPLFGLWLNCEFLFTCSYFEFSNWISELIISWVCGAPCNLICVIALAYRCLWTCDLNTDSLSSSKSYGFLFAWCYSSINSVECYLTICSKRWSVILFLCSIGCNLYFCRIDLECAVD